MSQRKSAMTKLSVETLCWNFSAAWTNSPTAKFLTCAYKTIPRMNYYSKLLQYFWTPKNCIFNEFRQINAHRSHAINTLAVQKAQARHWTHQGTRMEPALSRHTSNPALPQTLPQAGALQDRAGGSLIINFTDPAQGCSRFVLYPEMPLPLSSGSSASETWGKRSRNRNICTPNWLSLIPDYIAHSEHLVLQHGLWCIRIIQETSQVIVSLQSLLANAF